MITIEKAIELLTLESADPGSVDVADLREAYKISIEGLSLITLIRKLWGEPEAYLLPNETKE